MYIIVAGGGKVGRFLTEALVNDGYEVLLIEKNRAKVERYLEQLGGVVVQGDACEAQVLNEAGATRADVVIAVTGDDEDNLVICQMAKRKFDVDRVIARINNPKNERIFHKLGIDATVNHTDAILNLIARELPQQTAWQMLHLRRANHDLVNVLIGADSPAVAKTLGALNFPSEVQVLSIIREGKPQSPSSGFALRQDDEVLIFAPHQDQTTLKRILLGN